MSVHFDFILSDEDAENLMDIINYEKYHIQIQIFEAHLQSPVNKAMIKALKKSVKYVDTLKKKMLNHRE